MIGIITLQSKDYNYGAILQNYALCSYLNKNKFESNAIYCNYSKFGFFSSLLYKKFRIKVLKNNKKIKISLGKKCVCDRNKCFDKFINQNIKYKKFISYSNKTYAKIDRLFSKVIVGSDQVWNPKYGISIHKRGFSVYLLTFLPPEKRISYAASIGVDKFPEEIADQFAEEIKKFKAVSVREERGAEIIKELSGVDAEVLIDPTMLLTREEWLSVAKKHPNRSDKPYVLKYFLGNQSVERKAYIKNIAQKNNLGIYDLMNENSKVFTSGPAEFLDLIANAEVVFTDSFHACVFSILMGRPFVVMDRDSSGMGNMNSRIITLLEKLGLEDRLPGKVTEDRIFECNYKNAYKKLKIERAKAKAFLENALKD